MKFPIGDVQGIIDPFAEGSYGGLTRFVGLPREALVKLVELGVADPGQNQNNSPTIGAMLDWPGDVTYEGYVVWPPRRDARVSVDGMIARATPEDRAEVWARFLTADPDELDDDSEGGDMTGLVIRAWWD